MNEMARLTRDQLVEMNLDLTDKLANVVDELVEVKRNYTSAQQSASRISNELEFARNNNKKVIEEYTRRYEGDMAFKAAQIEDLTRKVKRLESVGHTSVNHLTAVLHDAIDVVDKNVAQYVNSRDIFPDPARTRTS
jgi:phosphohistidine phosphatase SixA